MDNVIKEIKHMRGYRVGRSVFNVICYADDVFIMENENDIQRLVYNFKKACQKYNIKIAKEQTKSITISHDSLRCKLVINDK